MGEDTVTGMVLAGIGHVDGQGKKNFLIVDSKTHQKDIADKFEELTKRKDICMIFITQGCADEIRFLLTLTASLARLCRPSWRFPPRSSLTTRERMLSCSAW